MSCIIEGEPNYVNFSIDYLIRTMCLLSGVLRTHDFYIYIYILHGARGQTIVATS